MKLKLLIISSLMGMTTQHMAMTEPAPRRSPNHPGYSSDQKDYDMSSPLGSGRSFPCRGTKPGPIYKTYSAGTDIDVHIAGGAKHGGGHCQFALTYDQKNFVVLKTVLGNCLTKSLDYQVRIPPDAPMSNVTLAWIWFNKIGNREVYMNCAEIGIQSDHTDTEITGPKMVIANLPGHPTFPEGFADDYAKELYESQPILSISPRQSSSYPKRPPPNSRPTIPEQPPVPRPTLPNNPPVPRPTIPKQPPVPRPTTPEQPPVPRPTLPKQPPVPRPTLPKHPSVPRPTFPKHPSVPRPSSPQRPPTSPPRLPSRPNPPRPNRRPSTPPQPNRRPSAPPRLPSRPTPPQLNRRPSNSPRLSSKSTPPRSYRRPPSPPKSRPPPTPVIINP